MVGGGKYCKIDPLEHEQTGSAYMTLCVTFERYLVVCWPLRARHLCTVGRAKLAVVVFFLFAVSYNVPRFFELTYRERPRPKCTRPSPNMVSMVSYSS